MIILSMTETKSQHDFDLSKTKQAFRTKAITFRNMSEANLSRFNTFWI